MKNTLSLVFILTVMIPVHADIVHEISFTRGDFTLVESSGNQIINIEDGIFYPEPGKPAIPMQLHYVEIPSGSDVIGIQVDDVEWRMLNSDITISPQPQPQPLSQQMIRAVQKDRTIYMANSPYPSTPVVYLETVQNRKKTEAVLRINPIRYMPADGTVDFLSHLLCTIHTQDLNGQGQMNPEFTMTAEESYPYVIIATDITLEAYRPLADWRTETGLQAKLINLDSIETDYTGVDTEEKIRNFIKDAVANWNTQFVLIGENVKNIPIRYAHAMDCEMGSSSDNRLGADLYYSDLDGSWNDDGDDIYGEVDDGVDLLPDVLVGRVPATSYEEAAGYVTKVLNYEQSPSLDALMDCLFIAGILWEDPFTDGGDAKNIAAEYVPAQFQPMEKMYETADTLNLEVLLNRLNIGGHFYNHNGHGSSSGIPIVHETFSSAMAYSLTNLTRPWICYSVGCYTADLGATKCFAQQFVCNPNGGAICYIGNYRYGWGMPGNPGFGYSDRYDTQFFKMLFESDNPVLGQIFADHKAYFAGLSRQANVFRWIQYQLNLLGDPAIPVWTDTPQTLSVDHPGSFSEGISTIPVWVGSKNTGLPGARVCLYREGDWYRVGMSDQNGQVNIEVPSVYTGSLTLTVTAPNHLPYQTSITSDDYPDVRISDVSFDDTTSETVMGNGDGVLELGEQVTISPKLTNYVTTPATNISAELRCNDPGVIIHSNKSTFPDISTGSPAEPDTPFVVEFSHGCQGNKPIRFILSTTHSGMTSDLFFSIMPCSPVLNFKNFIVYDYFPGGDADGILEPGETAYISMMIENTGLSTCPKSVLDIDVVKGGLELIGREIAFPDIAPGETQTGYDRIWIHAKPDSTWEELSGALKFTDKSNEKPIFDALPVPIGESGFSDDCEVKGAWTTDGENNAWHLSENRPHSGTYSWYCGSEKNNQYDNNLYCSLESEDFLVPVNPELHFYRWFDFYLYGADGLKVELLVDGDWEQIDFIAGGGALNLTSDWFEENYTLPIENCQSRLRFTFLSDGSGIGEGIYLDEIRVISSQAAPWGSEPAIPAGSAPPDQGPGVTLHMPGTYYHTGDTFALYAWINPGDAALKPLDLYLILDVFGEYFFAPSWTADAESISKSWPQGLSQEVIFSPFEWPYTGTTLTGILFWAGLVNPENMTLHGAYDYWEFGWGTN